MKFAGLYIYHACPMLGCACCGGTTKHSRDSGTDTFERSPKLQASPVVIPTFLRLKPPMPVCVVPVRILHAPCSLHAHMCDAKMA